MRILVILHGLTGGSLTNYMGNAALNGYRFGFRTVCVNMRGVDSPMKVQDGEINKKFILIFIKQNNKKKLFILFQHCLNIYINLNTRIIFGMTIAKQMTLNYQ